MQQLIDLRNETHEAIALQAIGALMGVGQPAIVLFSGGRLFDAAERCAYDDLVRPGRRPASFGSGSEGLPAPATRRP